jgi:RNA polymerase sigma-70 factor, ECF subfamily
MVGDAALVERARTGDRDAFQALVAPHLREMRAHCYRMLGSLHDADDAVQDSLVRGWRGFSGFEERSPLRSWLHRIATNVCLDIIERGGGKARTLPWSQSPAREADDPPPPAPVGDEPMWIEPFPDELAPPASPDATMDARESIALAFLVMLQELPPKQRAVLLLRDVLGFRADEVAESLGLSVAATNSALQRARESARARPEKLRPPGEAERDLLARYLQAWESADVSLLVNLLRTDAKLSMPPLPYWYQGADAIVASLAAMVLGPEARGLFRGVHTRANGMPAVAMYRRDGERFIAFAIHVVRPEGDRIADIVAFLDPRCFEPFGLPETLSD